MVAPPRCRDQAELLDAFAVPVAILQDAEALSVAAAELVEDLVRGRRALRRDPVRAGVARRAAASRSPDVIAAVAAGVRRRRCAAAAAPVDVRLITIAMRTDPPERSVDVARAAVAARDLGVVGFDLAGLEATAPDMTPHLPAFGLARDGGLAITIHAGEWGGAAQVRAALAVRPDRIAHGGPAADDPALMRRAHGARHHPGPVPHEQRPGRARGATRGPPAAAPAACRRARHAVHGRPHRQRHRRSRMRRSSRSDRWG